MPRYCDIDVLKARIKAFNCGPCKEYGADRDGIRCPFCNTGQLLAEIDKVPTADVVEKERYDMLFENANILAEEMRKYQRREEETEDGSI